MMSKSKVKMSLGSVSYQFWFLCNIRGRTINIRVAPSGRGEQWISPENWNVSDFLSYIYWFCTLINS